MFSTVFRCRHQVSQREYACKKFVRAKMSPTTHQNLNEEIRVLQALPQCDHIVSLHDAIKTKKHFYVVLEYCNGGDLEALLEEKGILNEQES